MVTSMLSDSLDKSINVHLPHDGMIHEARDKTSRNGGDSGYYPGGVYEYMKTLFVPADWESKNVYLFFEGIQGLARIMINGVFVEHSYNGYIDTIILMNDYLKYNQDNVIEVTTNTSMEQTSRWYTGSGIYRNATLWVGEKTYLPLDGLKIQTLDCNNELAVLQFDIEINNERERQKLDVEIEMYNKNNETVLKKGVSTLSFHNSTEYIHQKCYLTKPNLWSSETPALYDVKVRLLTCEGNLLDEQTIKYGIRKVQIDPYNGLRINDNKVKLKGTCLHHDNGILGAVCLEDAERRKLAQLKNAGFNSIRSSHNPMSRTTLALCDELGFYVIDELTDMWNEKKNINDYANVFALLWEIDIKKMVAKDFNHPSVIIYSNGNEIREAGNEYGARLNRQIVAKFHELDPSRYVTSGLNGIVAAKESFYELIQEILDDENQVIENVEENEDDLNAINGMQAVLVGDLADAISTHDKMTQIVEPFIDGLDIAGYNYLTGRHVWDKTLDPHRIVLGMETFPADIYNLWDIVKSNPHVIGDFTWTGYDYLGEAGVGVYYYNKTRENFKPEYPDRVAFIGDIDLIGHRRPISYYRQIVFGDRKEPYIAVQRINKIGKPLRTPWMWPDVISSWTWTGYDGKLTQIDIYSDAPEVEVFLNDRSLGKKPCGIDKKYIARYSVPYESGTLKVVNYRDGLACESYILQSASSGAKLLISVDKTELKANGQDLAYIGIQLADQEGNPTALEEATIKIQVNGVAQLVALGSANPSDEGNYYDNYCKTYDGAALAIIRANIEEGKSMVTITAEGYDSKEIRIKTYK